MICYQTFNLILMGGNVVFTDNVAQTNELNEEKYHERST